MMRTDSTNHSASVPLKIQNVGCKCSGASPRRTNAGYSSPSGTREESAAPPSVDLLGRRATSGRGTYLGRDGGPALVQLAVPRPRLLLTDLPNPGARLDV